jgi:ankyrin repeat protein/serine/threonine protein kinase
MADEDEWGFPIAPKQGVSTGDGVQASNKEDEFGFPTAFAPDPAPPPKAVPPAEDEEDEWGFSTGLSKDAAPVAIKEPLNEDEWGFATESDPSDLLSKWGFDSDSDSNLTPAQPTPSSTSSSVNPGDSLFEGWKTATRTSKLGTSLATFISILSNLDIPGPQHLLVSSLKDRAGLRDRAYEIGQGTQFTVFLDQWSAEADDGSGRIVPGKGVVIKRVRISKAALKGGGSLEENEAYRQTLRHLELEALSLGLLRHRNIVQLTGWGYDYEDRYTPIPVLFMNAALAPLTDFLKAEIDGEGLLVGLGKSKAWSVKYQLALDVTAGLAAIHELNIVHGDVKPDNVLIFIGSDEKVPYVGKLSDFGVCVDMKVEGVDISAGSYLGTPAWTGSEVGVGAWKDDIHGAFEPSLLKNFDSYSLGMTLLSIFGCNGEVPEITKEPGPERAFGLFMEVEEVLEKAKGCPDEIINKLKESSKKLLAIKPADRPLPGPSLLQTDLVDYHEWVDASASASSMKIVKKRGHSYWFGLDMNVLKSLDREYTQKEKRGKDSGYSGELLFGMAEASQQPIEDGYGKVLKYLLAAANKGHIPARAICSKVYEALDAKFEVDAETLKVWESESVRDGFMFNYHPFLKEDHHSAERQDFRANGGFCDDAFLGQKSIVTVAKDASRLSKWLQVNDINTNVDSAGNTMMHVCAALGNIESLKLILSKAKNVPLNENGETPLYKACQAGHAEAVHLLIKASHKPTTSTATDISSLHWLFTFPDSDKRDIAVALVDAGADLNSLIKPARHYGRAEQYQKRHFPFEWPHGTPFHWACFARNKTAMDILLDLGADINTTYDGGNLGTTPLAKAVYVSDVPVVEYLIAKGADASAKSKEGENLLHIMSLGAGNEGTLASRKFDSWVRHGSWEERLQAAKDIVRILVNAGVDIEGKASTYGKYTPLLAATSGVFQKEHVVAALLDAGSDTSATNASEDTTLLHEWCGISPDRLQYPHIYTDLLRKIVTMTKDLEGKGGSLEETALHMLVKQKVPTTKLLEHIKILVNDPQHYANVNARDRDGDTPLMKMCSTVPEGITEKLNFLLDHAADPTLMNEYQENFLRRLIENYTLMDADSLSALKTLFAHPAFTPESQESFVSNTDLKALVDTCTSGRLTTLRYLLSLGFSKHVNETIVIKGVETTTLDQAFFAADSARLTYIRYASTYLSDEDLKDADEKNMLYTSNAHVRGTYGGPSPERGREAYWAFPDILRILQEQGGMRMQLNNRGPTFTDALHLPTIGMRSSTQPNHEHWKPLYDLDELQAGWEDEAWEEFQSEWEYLDDREFEILDVPVMVYEIWGERVCEILREKGGQGKEGWYRGILRDGRKVEVNVVEGKIQELRDIRGRSMNAGER